MRAPFVTRRILLANFISPEVAGQLGEKRMSWRSAFWQIRKHRSIWVEGIFPNPDYVRFLEAAENIRCFQVAGGDFYLSEKERTKIREGVAEQVGVSSSCPYLWTRVEELFSLGKFTRQILDIIVPPIEGVFRDQKGNLWYIKEEDYGGEDLVFTYKVLIDPGPPGLPKMRLNKVLMNQGVFEQEHFWFSKYVKTLFTFFGEQPVPYKADKYKYYPPNDIVRAGEEIFDYDWLLP